MSWERGKGSVEVELANVQSYIESIDPELRGDGVKKGVISIVRSNEDKKEQRDEDIGKILKVLAWIGPVAVVSLILQVLRFFKVAP